MRAIRVEDSLPALIQAYNSGTVYSVYSHVMNLSIGGRIVAVMMAGAEEAPDSILTDFSDSFLRYADQVGRQIRVSKEQILLPDGTDIELRGGITYFAGLTGTSITEKTIDFAKVLQAQELLRLYGKQEDLYRAYFRLNEKTTLQGMFEEILSDLEKQTCPTDYVRCATRMVGLGIGLTPSGDDFLAGFLLVLQILRPDLHSPLLAIVEPVLKKTNRISRQMILNAGNGKARRSELDFLEGLSDKRTATVKKSVHAILQFGETSGTDTLIGILTALHLMKTE